MSLEQTKNTRLNIDHLGQNCSVRGTEIMRRQIELAELNKKFPGERRKPFKNRHPDYVLKRSQISKTLELLIVRQREERIAIRELI